MALESVTACPLCGNNQLKVFLTCKDHNYSGESFEIAKCPQCTLLITTPRPDQQSVGQYYKAADYISHTGKSTGLISSIYKQARGIALKSKHRIINKIHKPGNLLDIGCGTGEFIHHMNSKGWHVQGIEPSSDARTRADQLNPGKIVSSLSEIGEKKFVAITLWHVLEHLPDLDHYLAWMKQHLEPKGTIFVAVPNHRSFDAVKYGSHWAGYDVPRHFWHFNQNAMTKLMQNQSLHVQQALPMKLDAYYVSLLSEKYLGKGIVWSYFNGLINGWRSNQKAKQTGEYSSLLYIIGQ